MRRGAGKLGRHVWRLYPDPELRSRYVQVIVWDRLDAMRRYVRLVMPAMRTRLSRRLAGCCTTPEVQGPRVATVILCRKHIGGGLVAHEMTHAAVAWGGRRRWDFAQMVDRRGVVPRDAVEERMADTVGTLVRDFYRKADAAGLYP